MGASGTGIGVSWSGAGDTVTSVAAKLKALRRPWLELVVVQRATGEPQDACPVAWVIREHDTVYQVCSGCVLVAVW